MEQNGNKHVDVPSPEAAPSGSASPIMPARVVPPPDLRPLISNCLTETFAEGGRKPRHDGWTADRIAGFLYTLAESATVETAARAVGMSVTSAYAFRNRRKGRAFAKMWDAILIHRSRVRLAADNAARAVNGIVSKRVRDGVVVEELHHHDNRLAMAVLTRLDRLAEREAPNDDHLRALSENLDDYIECLESGGDADAFVEALRPAPPVEPAATAATAGSGQDESDRLRMLGGGRSWRDVPPLEIPIADLDYAERGSWTDDQWIRAQLSGFLIWSAGEAAKEATPRPVAPATAAFMRRRAWVATRRAMAEAGEAAVPVGDLDPEAMLGWDSERWERAHHSGLLRRLPGEAWLEAPEAGSEGPCQSSTSSTSPGTGEDEDGSFSTNHPAPSANGTDAGTHSSKNE